jgi:class 3 adenylate cyclase
MIARWATKCQDRQSELIQLRIRLAFVSFRDHGAATQLEDELGQLLQEVETRRDEALTLDRHIADEIRRLTEQLRQMEGDRRGDEVNLDLPAQGRKTVLQFDMASYSDVAHTLQRNFGIAQMEALDQEIQGFGDAALIEIDLVRSQVVVSEGGDGATFAFDEASDAFNFAEAFFAIVQKRNTRTTDASIASLCKRFFRMGAATAELIRKPTGRGLFATTGTVIADAVRLQDGGKPGELFVDEATYRALPAKQKKCFETEPVTVKGKRKEVFTAYRCIFDAGAADEAQQLGLWQPKS